MTLLRRAIAALLLLTIGISPAFSAGTLYGLGLSQQVDNNGRPLVGAQLSIYTAGTLNPAQIFSDYQLTQTAPNPLVTDGNGRIPTLWLADGVYRARLVDASGNVIFDIDNIQTVGNVGGGGGGGVDATTILATGDIKCRASTGTLTGWVRLNGKTIGSATSGASERANADTQNLYTILWNSCADAQCPVSGGRGASASADFTNNKTITLPDARSRAIIGLDDMGNVAAGRITGNTVLAAGGGAQNQAIAQANLPNVNLSVANISASTSLSNNGNVVHGTGFQSAQTSSSGTQGVAGPNLSSIGASTTISGFVPLGGSGTPLTTLSPYLPVTCYVKI
jgi:hypothetical protein